MPNARLGEPPVPVFPPWWRRMVGRTDGPPELCKWLQMLQLRPPRRHAVHARAPGSDHEHERRRRRSARQTAGGLARKLRSLLCLYDEVVENIYAERVHSFAVMNAHLG